jgi:selenocysteine lyase/cysteine desulfurase
MEERKPSGPTQADWVTPGGFVAYEHQWAMTEAIGFHQSIGSKRIALRIAELNGRMKEGLAGLSRVRAHTPRDPAFSAGIACFDVDGMKAADVVSRLYEQGIIATESPYARSHVRLAAGIMHTPEEVDRAVDAVGTL